MEWPKPYQVFQRNNSNLGWVYVKGACSNLQIDSLKISAVPVQSGQSKIKSIPVNSSGQFEGAIQLVGWIKI